MAVGLALLVAAVWTLQQRFAEETYEAAAVASNGGDDSAARALLRDACEEGSRRACEALRNGGVARGLLH